MYYICRVKFYLAVIKNGLITSTGNEMELEAIMLSEKKKQALKDKHYQLSIFYAESKFKYVCMCMHTFSQVMKVVSELCEGRRRS